VFLQSVNEWYWILSPLKNLLVLGNDDESKIWMNATLGSMCPYINYILEVNWCTQDMLITQSKVNKSVLSVLAEVHVE